VSAEGLPAPVAADEVHEVGRIVDAWGVKGWIKVQPHAVDPQALLHARRWLLRPAEGALPPPGASTLPASIDIEQMRRHGAFLVALPQGCADRAGAEALRGARVLVSRAAFPRPATDEYYWVDLIGLSVVNRAGEALGRVAGLVDNGAQVVLRVQPADVAAAERLIPFVAAYVDDVDLEAGRLRVDWGLDF
jgi:16S rRNA processing protein RimM